MSERISLETGCVKMQEKMRRDARWLGVSIETQNEWAALLTRFFHWVHQKVNEKHDLDKEQFIHRFQEQLPLVWEEFSQDETISPIQIVFSQ